MSAERFEKIETKVWSGMTLTATKNIMADDFLLIWKGATCSLEYIQATPKKEGKCYTGIPYVLKGEFDIEYKIFGFRKTFNDLSLFEELKDLKF